MNLIRTWTGFASNGDEIRVRRVEAGKRRRVMIVEGFGRLRDDRPDGLLVFAARRELRMDPG